MSYADFSSQPNFSEEFLAKIASVKRISKGELAALKLALLNRKSKDIAEQLGISEAAARKRLGEVYKKFEIKGRGPGKLASLEKYLISQAAGLEKNPLDERVTASMKAIERSSKQFAPVAIAPSEQGDLPDLTQWSEPEDPAGWPGKLPDNPGLETQYHWHNAPTLSLFQGRRDELKFLKRWVLKATNSYKLLAICGIGGIGKTSLAAKLAESADGYFHQIVWIPAKSTQAPAEFVRRLIDILQPEQNAHLSSAADLITHADQYTSEKSFQQLIQQLLSRLSRQRCLIIIDGFETVFRSYNNIRIGNKAGSEAIDIESSIVSPSVTENALNLPSEAGAHTEELHANHLQAKAEQSNRGLRIAAFKSSSRTPTFESSRQQQASLYKERLEGYGELLRALQRPASRFSEAGASCVVLTSREKPRELLSIPAENPLAYLYTVNGLRDHEAARMLRSFHLEGKAADYQDLIDRYYGHPMALRLAANAVKDIFYGRIRDFLDQEISVFDDLRGVIKTQFKRLSGLEIEVMYWLAINNTPCALEDLQADIVSQDHKKNLLYTLQSLERRFLVEVKHSGSALFSLHPIVAEYVLTRFIREIFEDLIHGDLSLFNRHALLKADTEEFLREFQRNAIVRPILERLRNYCKSLYQVDEHLSRQLDFFRENNPHRLGYAGGNFVNLMVELSQGKLSRKDFSQLTIWQAYLQGAQLRDVNFNSCELNRSVFTETLSDVMTIALSDSQQPCSSQKPPLLACGDTNGVVHIWHTHLGGTHSSHHSGQKCTEWAAHSGWVRAITFIPHQPFLVTGGDDSKLKLWHLPSPSQTPATQAKQIWQQSSKDWIQTIAISPDGRTIASGGEHQITLYNAGNGRELCCFSHQGNSSPADPVAKAYRSSQLTKHSQVRSLSFSPDGQWLVSSGDDNIIRVWSLAELTAKAQNQTQNRAQSNSAEPATELTEPATELTGHTDWVQSLQFTPDGKWLLSGSHDKTIRVWDWAQKTCAKVLHQPNDHVRSLAISPDGQFLASGGDDCQVMLWNLNNYQLLQTLSTRQSRIWSVGFQQQRDRLLLAAGGDKQTLMLWQIHKSEIKPSAEAATEQQEQPILRATPRRVKTYRGYTNGIRSVSFLGERRIIGGGDSRDLSVWDSQSGELKASLSLHQGRIWAIAVDLQNARIASASDDHSIRLWDASTGQCLTTLSEHTSWVRAIAFSNRGRFLASSGDDCTIRIWNTASGFCLKVLEYSTHWIRAVSFDPNNSRYLVSGGDDQIVRRWDRKEGICQSLATHDHRICSVAYSPDGRYVASGSDDNTVILWDMEEGEQCDRFTASELGIKAVAFSPDGQYLAAGGEDQMVYIWNLESTERPCFRLRPRDYTGSTGGIRSVAFSPDSQFVISGGLDEMIRIGDLRDLKPSGVHFLRPLIQHDRPYENIKIESVRGLNGLQKANLLTLGAIDRTASLLF
ncbi:MAG: AAA family ATPase [Cyanobacteria bacterium J06627_32]